MDIKFDLAFKGLLGNEPGAVIGKTFQSGVGDCLKKNGTSRFPETMNGRIRRLIIALLIPPNGETLNSVEGDSLIKENRRYADYHLVENQ